MKRTQLKDFFSEEFCKTLFKALEECQIRMSGRQMDWSMDLEYRWSLHGMNTHCSEQEKGLLLTLDSYRIEQAKEVA